MRIYLAAQFKEQEAMRIWRKILQDNDHVITSRWLDHTEAPITHIIENIAKANIDLVDIDAAECMISSTLQRGDMFTGGGRHIEFGYALAKNKRLINIGGHENVFHHKALITVPYIQDALKYLK